MHRTDMAPSPINLVTTWVVYLLRMCQRGVLLFSCCGVPLQNLPEILQSNPPQTIVGQFVVVAMRVL